MRRMTLTWGWDATAADLAHVPAGQGAGYTTELPNPDGTSPGIKWSDADWAAHPGAVRICQDAGATDTTADVLDVELFAATPQDVPGWFNQAHHEYLAGTRPGQRYPAVYCSLSMVPDVAAELAGANANGAPDLWVAHWGITMDEAAALIGTAINGLTVVGVQFADRGAYDADVWDAGWLAAVSEGGTPPPPPPPSDPLHERLTAMPELAEGATGNAVRTLQGLLVARGYNLGNTGFRGVGIDGDFGAITTGAVRTFQESQGIAVDGIVGPQTWPLLPQS